MGGTTGSRRYEDEPPVMTVGFSDEYSDFDDFDPKKDFNDLQAQICPPTLRCYGLKSCKMFEADVARLADVKWDTGSLNHLELDMNTKGLLRSVVEQHKKNSDHSVRDVIQGKEKGLVIALHGPPGVGKTLTAETIAEYAQKPLLPINTGDLTGDVDVLACLNQVFCLAARWDAILLLDGADDLLKKRSYEDLGSNSLVSIFLRMLEYFEGIMFMTTNRVETIDLAFQSRIDIAIKYDTLTPEKRRRIWERFIDRLDEREEEAKSELRDKLDDIQEWELNGRQIRNVLAIAESTALNDQRRRGALRYRHIETIANETLDFQNFLQNSHKQRKKHAEAGRYVTALQAAAFSGKEDVVRQLIQRGATVNATGGIFETALQAASHQGHDNVVRLLLKAGADANIKVGEYSNAITAAFRKGNWSTVDILREITAEVDMQAGIEASHGAAAQRSVDLSEQLQTILTAKPQPMTIFAFFTWEIPAVISIGNVRPANPPLASEQSKLRNHVTLVKRHVMNAAGERTILLEALTCLSYVKQRWGALGEQVLNDVIWICSQEVGQHNECSYQSSDNRLEYSLDTTESSICITINPVKFGAGSGSVLQVVDFLCKAVRLPQDQGGQPGIVISSSTCRVPRVNEGGKLLAQDSSSGRDVLLSCDLSTHPITGLKDECWEYLFESCYIVEDNQLEQSKRVLGKGLKMPFDLMVTLAGTGYQVDVAGGIILTGYSTALIPTHLEDEYAQFHLVVDNLEVNQRKQINPFLLSEVPRELVTDLKIFATLPCFLGWCESAQIKLGSRDLLESTLPEANITYSNSKQRGKVLQFTGINAGLQAASAAPLQAGGNLALNYSVASLRLRFGAEAEYLAMILRASQEIVLICDVAKNRSWLLPKLSLLLHMAHIWHKKYVQNSCHSPDPIPFVSPHDEEIDVVLALKSHGGIPVIEQGDDSFKLRTLMLGLNINLQDSLPLLELQQSKGDNLFGFEVMDVVTEPPRGCNPRKVKIGSSHSWVALANNADAVLTCANLGEAIAPKFCATRPNPKCNYLKANKGYLAAHVSVLCLLADRTGKDHGLLLEDPGIPIPDDHRYLSITGNPFAVCNHGINDAQNCWERKDMLQKLTSQRSFAAIFGTQLPVHPQNLCVKGALVFGGN
ncbi:MAG: hypothetical protein M1821_000601 [Bathelium mastoideum]|nr:MAG: hypothetical protein M1821_000601 [Bathelium mastoideum]